MTRIGQALSFGGFLIGLTFGLQLGAIIGPLVIAFGYVMGVGLTLSSYAFLRNFNKGIRR